MLKDNPVMKKLVATGEERIGQIAQQLLANEKFVGTIQSVVTRTLQYSSSGQPPATSSM